MATKFYDAPGSAKNHVRELRVTKFTHTTNREPTLQQAQVSPRAWQNVQYLFTDRYGYDHFKVWDREGDYAHYIGKRGDEYYEPC